MNMQRPLAALAVSLLAASAMAQTGTGKPLNLKLAPGSVPAASSSAAPAASSTTAKPAAARPSPRPDSRAPGVYYGDTSGRMGNTDTTARTRSACDDSTYNQPQIHGSVGMGVVSGSRMSGNYQTGTVNISRAFGSCDEPRGGMSISIGAGTGNFRGRGR